MRASAVFISLFLAASGCGGAADDPVPLRPNAVVFKVDRDGKVLENGKPIKVHQVALPEKTDSLDQPAVIDAAPGLRMKVLVPLLLEILKRSANITLMAGEEVSSRAVILPTMLDMTTGPVQHGAERVRPHQDLMAHRLWIHVQVGEGGSLVVRRFALGPHPDLVFVEDPVYRPSPGEKARPVPKDDTWTGPHPPLGLWTAEELRFFMEAEAIRRLDPYVKLEVVPGDRVGDVALALGTVRAVVGTGFEADVYAGKPAFLLLQDLPALLGKTVEDMVKRLRLGLGRACVIDEPPGIARGVRGRTKEGAEVWLYTDRNKIGFAENAQTQLPTVKKMKIVGVAVKERGLWRGEGKIIGRYHQNPR